MRLSRAWWKWIAGVEKWDWEGGRENRGAGGVLFDATRCSRSVLQGFSAGRRLAACMQIFVSS